MRLLLVEDEESLASMLAGAISKRGMVVDHVPSLEMAWEAVAGASYDTIILDRGLPDGDGVDAIVEFRKKCEGVPVIILSALSSVQQKIEGLEHGADDYLGKPFSVDELIARVRALQRRPTEIKNETQTFGNLSYNPESRDVSVNGEPLVLPRRELLVLETLLRRSGRSVTRDALESAVFGYDDEIASNSLDAHISRLRKKLTDRGADAEIHAIRGIGYLLKVNG